MNTKTILLFCSIISNALSAQVGININTPQGVFHLDAQNNTESLAITTDDVIITNSGNMGIGTLTPNSKLEVQGNVIISDTDLVQGNIKANILSAQQGLRINKSDLTNLEPILEIYADSIGNGLKLEDGMYNTNDKRTMRMIPVMQEKPDDPGVLQWVNLPSVTKTVTGTIPTNTVIGSSLSNIGTPLILNEAGRWIIFATFTSLNSASPRNNNRSSIFVSLYDTSTNKEVARAASASESSGYLVSIPQLIHLVEITSPETFQIKAKSLITCFVADGFWGNPQLFAIKID